MIFKIKERTFPGNLSVGEMMALHLAVQVELKRYKGIPEDYWTADLQALKSADDKLWSWLFGEEVKPLVHLEWQMCSTVARIEFNRFQNWPQAYWTQGMLDTYRAMNITDDIYREKRKA